MAFKLRLIVVCLFVVMFLWAGIGHFTGNAQEKSAAPTPTPAPQADGFGNVQLLKDVRDLLPTMHFIRASLGVRCDYCHVTELNKYRLDDKPAKRRAREMIMMTRQLNERAFGGRQLITCNTCHRGSTKPVDIPQIATSFVNTTRVESFEPPPPAMPAADEVLARYEAATHITTLGPVRLRIESHRGKLIDGGTPKARMLPRADISISEALVDGERGSTTLPSSNGQLTRVGSIGGRIWFLTANGPQWIGTGDLGPQMRKINPLLVTLVRAASFTSMSVAGLEPVNGIDAYVITATAVDNSVETLWFAKSNGLLLRRTYFRPTLLGLEPEQYDLSGYKGFGKAKVPIVINVSYLDDQHLGILRKILDLKPDVSVSERDFEPPAH